MCCQYYRYIDLYKTEIKTKVKTTDAEELVLI
jgi:hypothetical protein